MQSIKTILKNKWFILAIGLILFSLIIFWAGPYIGLAEFSHQLTAFALVLLVIALAILFQYHRKRKLQQKMLDDLSGDSEIDEMINAESGELKRKFELAFSLLKSNKGNSSSLTELPWYMIIGSPGSGKTTLLSNSGLKFPLFNEFSNQAVQGVGGTKNCDWWITQDAVLLDTAGRYTSRDSHQKADESGWNNFLSLIKKYRRKPISGLLVSFSLSDLLTMNEYELGQQLVQVKRRVAEINDYFSTRFPVYVVITKTDMLAGFSQFYETFSHKEREQTFGITFDASCDSSADLLANFSIEFKRLTQSITRRQWQRISLERDPSRKSLVYGFSHQFSSLKDNLSIILENLSSDADNLTTGIVRGLYFTSGTQHGAPIDRMIAKVSQTFGLKNTAQVLWNNDQRSYFIKELLQQVIFPESDQFGVLAGYEKRKRLFKKVSIACAGIFTLGLCISWLISFGNNVDHIELSEKSVNQWFEQYQASDDANNIKQYIPALNDFSSNVELLKDNAQANFSGLGLDQSNALEEAFSSSYQRLLSTVLLPYIKVQMEQTLKSSPSPEARYRNLKAYTMLGEADRRDKAFLLTWFNELINNNVSFTESERIYLAAHSKEVILNNMSVASLDQQLIDESRRLLKSESMAAIFYQQFKQGYLDDPKNMLSMANLAGPEWRALITTDLDPSATMSRLFTANIYQQVIDKALPAYLIKLQSESWLLGDNSVSNSKTLLKELERIYARDYVRQWQQLLNSITVKVLNNTNDLETALMLSGTIDSPFLRLLENAANETKLVDTTLDETAGLINENTTADLSVLNASDLRRNDSSSVFITSQFTKLHELMRKERSSLLQQKLAVVTTELSMTVGMFSTDESSEPEALKNLQALAYRQPRPLKPWLEQLSNQVEFIQQRQRREQMAIQWQEDILPQCQDVTAFSYPFTKSASTDATARELTLLFARTGIIHQFFAEHIEPLIANKTPPWRWKKGVAQNYGLSDEVLSYFEQFNRIQKSLFAGQSNQLHLGLSFKPLYLDATLSKFEMSLYGTPMRYQFGRQVAKTVVWPPQNTNIGSQYTFVRRSGSPLITAEKGLFSLFRLIDKTSKRTINANKVELTFKVDAYSAKYELMGMERSDPLIMDKLARFTCSANL